MFIKEESKYREGKNSRENNAAEKIVALGNFKECFSIVLRIILTNVSSVFLPFLKKKIAPSAQKNKVFGHQERILRKFLRELKDFDEYFPRRIFLRDIII